MFGLNLKNRVFVFFYLFLIVSLIKANTSSVRFNHGLFFGQTVKADLFSSELRPQIKNNLKSTPISDSYQANNLPNLAGFGWWSWSVLSVVIIILLLLKLWRYRVGVEEIMRMVKKYLPEIDTDQKSSKQRLNVILEALRLLKQKQVEAEQNFLSAEGQKNAILHKLEEFEQLVDESKWWQEYFWNQTHVAFALLSEKNHFLKVNQAFSELVHLSPDKLTDQPFETILSEQIKNPVVFPDFKNGPLSDSEVTLQTESTLWFGKNVWWKIHCTAFPVNLNTQNKLIAIEDLSDYVFKISELAQRKKHFQLLFNKANDPVFVNQLTQDQRFGHFIEVNQKAIETYLYSREEFNYLNPLTLIPPEHRAKHEQITQQLIKDKHVIYEIEYFRKDKRRIPVEINAHLFEFHGQPTVLSIVRDISDRKRAQQALKNFSSQLRNLASRLQDIREEERAMIAREIHDELGQLLTVLKIEVSLLCRDFAADNEQVKNKVDVISDLINQAVQTIQQITAKLRPGILDEIGLVAALEWQAEEFSKHTGIPCKIHLPEQEIKLDQEKSTALFRIFQESLTNVARHSQANRVSIFLKSNNDKVLLEIIDNGRGINRQQIESPQSLGLLGMRERAMVFGGQLEIHGVAGQGTRVKVELPL